VAGLIEKASAGGTGSLAEWLPQTRGTDAERTDVIPSSPVADRTGANAITVGPSVHLSSRWQGLEPAEQARVLAHEAVHVAQHAATGPSASREILEREAHRLAVQVLGGRAAEPLYHADPMMVLADDGGPLPDDVAAVQRAKARKEVLLRWKAIYDVSGPDVKKEREKIRDRREKLDETMRENLKLSGQRFGKTPPNVEDYWKEEERLIAGRNLKPVTLEVTKKAVRVKVKFQVRFEGLAEKDASQKFSLFKKNFLKGVSDTWNQELRGNVLSGRTFEMVPELTLVAASAPRDQNYWLITVAAEKSPGDNGRGKNPPKENALKKGSAKKGPQETRDEQDVNVTDPTSEGGVMALLSSAVGDPSILGHESLHLFGLADRYVIGSVKGSDKPEPFSLRDTKGRDDPLGADPDTGKPKGKILEEDLGFVLDKLGVYPKESQAEVETELEQVEKVIKTGRNPNSLVRKRQNFEDKMKQQVEDLP
jgi:hypothetical protein